MADQTIISVDARGLRCPLPVLRLARAMRESPQAAAFEIVADDPAATHDLPAYAAEIGWAYEEAGHRRWRFLRP